MRKSKNEMRSPEEKEIIVKEYLDGETAVKLTNKYNLPDKLIYRWIRKYEENFTGPIDYQIEANIDIDEVFYKCIHCLYGEEKRKESHHCLRCHSIRGNIWFCRCPKEDSCHHSFHGSI